MSVKVLSRARIQSNVLLRGWCADVSGRVLSIGSGGDIDKEGHRYREYFSQASVYVTSDIDPELRCNWLVDVRDMINVQDDEFDAVFCSGVLEHVDDIRTAIREVRRVLKPGGVFLVGVPFNQPVHRAPSDFWRVTEFGLRHLLRSFEVADVVAIGDPAFPEAYWAKAFKR